MTLYFEEAHIELKRPKRVLRHEVSNLKFLLYVDELEAYVDKIEKAISLSRNLKLKT